MFVDERCIYRNEYGGNQLLNISSLDDSTVHFQNSVELK